MIPNWKFWIWPTLLSSPTIWSFIQLTINPPEPSEDWRLLQVILILATYAVFLVPYWIVTAIRRKPTESVQTERRWGLLIPLVVVNLFWLAYAVAYIIGQKSLHDIWDALWLAGSVYLVFMLLSSLAVVGIYWLTISLTKHWRVLSRNRAKPTV